MSLTITWHTSLDDRVCPICNPLEGRQWVVSAMPDTLTSHGKPVWNTVKDQPRTHGHAVHNCRCWLTWTFDEEGVLAQLAAVKRRAYNLLTTIAQRQPL